MKRKFYYNITLAVLFLTVTVSCAQTETKTVNKEQPSKKLGENMEHATFGAGCFWCVEAIFQDLKGVEKVVSGYSGGETKNPTYREVTSGRTGHAEVIQVTYDTTKISFDELLEVFWQTHDPTTLNRQGADVGTQYRSAVFYHNEDQRKKAVEYKKALNESGAFSKPIVTEITAFDEFYPAEDYHQNYYKENPENQYCSIVIQPKLDKFKKVFQDKLKVQQQD